jgi:hypothetical protein
VSVLEASLWTLHGLARVALHAAAAMATVDVSIGGMREVAERADLLASAAIASRRNADSSQILQRVTLRARALREQLGQVTAVTTQAQATAAPTPGASLMRQQDPNARTLTTSMAFAV